MRLVVLAAVLALALPSSAAITGIEFDWSTFHEEATGSDNWPLTWCEDGHQYTSWGDGGGFGGTNTDGRVSLGFGRVSGTHASFTGTNLWGGKDPVNNATFGGKVVSMPCIGGDLFAWHSPGSNVAAFQYKHIILSEDKGLSWDENAFPDSRLDGEEGGPSLPYSIEYGQNYGANTDGYVYTYWIKIQDITLWDVQIPGVLWLMRAPVANRAFTDSANWEWLTGFSGSTPQWGTLANRSPVLQDTDGFMRGSAIYVPGLDRFLMTTTHTANDSGNIAIWESPEPWGPWTAILHEGNWPQSDPDAPPPSQFVMGSFSPKWFSDDGETGVFVFWNPDRWNSVEVTLLPEPGVAALFCGMVALAGLRLLHRGRAAL